MNKMTDSDDGMLSMDEDIPESDDDDDAGVDDIDEDYIISMEQEMEAIKPKGAESDHLYEVLTGDEVVELMQAIIREVNTIVQVMQVDTVDITDPKHTVVLTAFDFIVICCLQCINAVGSVTGRAYSL